MKKTSKNGKPLGRPEVDESKELVQKSIRMTAAQWEKVNAGGIKWLRGLVDRAKHPGKVVEKGKCQ
jgi:hypothetical protein